MTATISDREMQRLRALVRVFTKTNRILTGDLKVRVNLLDPDSPDLAGLSRNLKQAPGFTVYPDIYVNYKQFDNFKEARTVVQLLGLNYHELAHVLYTPRKFPKNWLSSDRERQAWNILEDQRIESFFTAKYPPAGKYFTEMVVRFYVEHPEKWSAVFPATYGRSFLPLEIRQEFEARYALQENVERMKYLINKYKKFTTYQFVNNHAAVQKVVAEFATLLTQQEDSGEPLPGDECGNPNPEKGEPNKKEEQEARDKDRQRRQKEEDNGEDQSGFWEDEDEETSDEEESGMGDASEPDDESGEGDDGEEDTSGDDDSGEGESGDGEGEEDDGSGSGSDDSDEPSNGDDPDESDGGDSDGEDSSDRDRDSSSDSEPGDSAGIGDSELESQFDNDELEDYLNDVVDAVNEDESVSQEVQQITAAMNDQGNIDVIDFDHTPGAEIPATPLEVKTSDGMMRELRRIYAEVEPGWKYGSDVGKLNVDRAMQDPENYDEMFDEWDEGREHEVGLEVFIAIDTSWSMSGIEIDQASRALWLLKRALDDVDAKTTVIGFSSHTHGLFSREQKVDRTKIPMWEAIGGTQPAHMFHLARRVLSVTDMPNKLFVCITDGDWESLNQETGQDEDLDNLIEQIPGTRLYIGLGQFRTNHAARQKFHARTDLRNSLEIGSVVRLAVNNILAERRRRS